jgi:hypothetical protein
MDESPAGSAEGAGDDRRRIAVAGIVGNVLEW